MRVLVVGGAGYIGSHCVRQLLAAKHEPVILDSLTYGHRKAVAPELPFYKVDLGDRKQLKAILEQEAIELVMHFAAFCYVDESVNDPFKYYENNVVGTLRLLEAMHETGVTRFVFSSSCATFGVPEHLPMTETLPQAPINPYGQTKLDVENLLKALAQAHGLSFAIFRYFNAAGASEDGTLGEDHDPETHLIPLVIKTALGQRKAIKIFGTDYPTPDGTCLRDYVHVDDLARAHIAVFDKLDAPGAQHHYNLGTGTPNSVREVIQAVETVTEKSIPVIEVERRPGDPPTLYADSSKAIAKLDWQPKFTSIQPIVETAWNWHAANPNGYQD